jgi:tRNA U34 5-carboxymethylaminomethyl modifying enzyme MnmG/GidA
MQRIGLDDAKVVINENNIDQLLYAENFINQRIEIKSIQNNFNTFNTYLIHTSEKEFDANEQKSKAPNVLYVSDTPQEDKSAVELIHTTCTYEKAYEHFLQLTKHKNSKLRPTDIEYFLCSNFSFEGRQPMHPAKPLFIQIAQRHLNQLFYDFQLCFDFRASIHGFEAYYALLKRTFQKQYMDTNIDSFKNNFSRKYPNYPFKSLR